MLRFELFERGTHVEARVNGLVSLDAWETMLGGLHVELAKRGDSRLLIDLFGALGYLGEADRRAVGALLATQLAAMKKVAIVVHASKITGVVQVEAQRQGLNLWVLPDRDEAIAWLLA